MKFHHKAFVRWDDLDAFGHVNNAKYLTLAQEARFHWSFIQHQEKGDYHSIVEMVVARAEIDFLAPIYEGGRYVDVNLWVDSIGNSSFAMIYEISDENSLFARIKTVQVAVDLQSKKSRLLTEHERDFLGDYLEEK
jgi:acyl-CoA thioester hydrolase